LKFGLNCGQFRAQFVVNMVHPVGAAIPIARVAQVALNLVQHGVNPRGGGVVLVMLDELMRGIPLASESEFNRFDQISVHDTHTRRFSAEQKNRATLNKRRAPSKMPFSIGNNRRRCCLGKSIRP